MSMAAFKQLHPGVQKAIFAMGWTKLRSIQVEAINAILNGSGHAIICAQTASGKTEAAFLPIISRLATERRDSVQALYVGPLKALINDQFRRLEQLCEALGIPVHRWHGDVSASYKKRFRDAPGGILLITPESLESNFINYGVHVHRLYAGLEFVVIDELHSFLPNVRGIHLRSLLGRLTHAIGRVPRVVGLSATLGDPLAARAFIAANAPELVSVLTDTSGKREVKLAVKAFVRSGEDEQRRTVDEIVQIAASVVPAKFQEPKLLHDLPSLAQVDGASDDLDDVASDLARNFSTSTNLVFGNAKQSLELLADRLHQRAQREHWLHNPFIVHHGSLAKDLRLEAEEILKSGRPTTALCSSTLEMGIDIGAVRAVGQVDPPWSVASLVQRLGRSGRREGEPSILRMYVREDSPTANSTITDLLFPDLVRAIALVRLMLAKWLEPTDFDRMHLSTLVHQVLSLLRQTGGMRAADLHEALVVHGPFSRISAAQFGQMLRDLARNEIIEQMPQGELILAPDGERITAAHDFYAAFDAGDEYSVRYEHNDIGTLQSSLIPPIGENLILAGRRWRVDQIEAHAKCVFVTPARGGKPPLFRGSRGIIHSRIVEEMRAVLLASDQPSYLDGAGQKLLAAARRISETTGVAQEGVLVRRDAIQWFPWVGTLGMRTIALHATAACIPHETDSLSITYKTNSLSNIHAHWREIAADVRAPLELARHMTVKTFEKFDGVLSDELLDVANARDQLDPSAARAAAAAALARCGHGSAKRPLMGRR
jgi:ATP-dependent Lhr-like helicase